MPSLPRLGGMAWPGRGPGTPAFISFRCPGYAHTPVTPILLPAFSPVDLARPFNLPAWSSYSYILNREESTPNHPRPPSPSVLGTYGHTETLCGIFRSQWTGWVGGCNLLTKFRFHSPFPEAILGCFLLASYCSYIP